MIYGNIAETIEVHVYVDKMSKVLLHGHIEMKVDKI